MRGNRLLAREMRAQVEVAASAVLAQATDYALYLGVTSLCFVDDDVFARNGSGAAVSDPHMDELVWVLALSVCVRSLYASALTGRWGRARLSPSVGSVVTSWAEQMRTRPAYWVREAWEEILASATEIQGNEAALDVAGSP